MNPPPTITSVTANQPESSVGVDFVRTLGSFTTKVLEQQKQLKITRIALVIVGLISVASLVFSYTIYQQKVVVEKHLADLDRQIIKQGETDDRIIDLMEVLHPELKAK